MAGPEQNITVCVRNALNKTSIVSNRLSPSINVKLVFNPSQTCTNQNLGHAISLIICSKNNCLLLQKGLNPNNLHVVLLCPIKAFS